MGDPRYESARVLELVRREYPSLTPGFTKVADYLLENHREAAFLTAADLARRSGVSESVVVRFAAHLGYAGYPQLLGDLRDLLRSELDANGSAHRPDEGSLGPHLEHDELFRRVLRRDASNLQGTADHPANRAIGRAVDALLAADSVYCVGMRGLNNLAGLMGFLLNMAGVPTHVITLGDATMFQQLNRIHAEDVLVTFAFHRYTKRTTRALELAREAGATTVVVTDSLASPAAGVADVVLLASVETEAFFNSYCAAVGIINALVISCAVRDPDRCEESLRQIESILPHEDFYG